MLWEHHFCLFIYSQAIYGNYLSRAKIGVKDHHAGNNLFPVDGYQFRGVNVRYFNLGLKGNGGTCHFLLYSGTV